MPPARPGGVASPPDGGVGWVTNTQTGALRTLLSLIDQERAEYVRRDLRGWIAIGEGTHHVQYIPAAVSDEVLLGDGAQHPTGVVVARDLRVLVA